MRDIKKAITDYRKKFEGTKRGYFLVTDYLQIKELSEGDIWKCMDNALMSGFMIGYRLGVKETKKKRGV